MNLKFIATGAACFSVGAILGWAITADRAEQKARRMANDFISMETMLREKTRYASHLELENERIGNRVDELEQKLYSDDENSPGVPPVEIVSGGEVDEQPAFPEGETPDQTRARLQAQVNQYTADEEAAAFVGEAARKVVESSRREPPFVISQEVYAIDDHDEEGVDYKKSTLTYYERHRVLVDEDNDMAIPQEEIEHLIGWRNLQQFGNESNDPDTVFIRNRAMDVDFEVTREVEEDLPLHIQYGMGKDEWDTRASAGKIRFREGDV